MIYGTYSSSTALFSKNEANEDAVVDNSDDEEMDDERDEFEDDVEFAQRLSADPLPFNHGGYVRWQGEMRRWYSTTRP